MYTFKKQFAGSSVNVAKYPRLVINKDNLNEPFVQKVISETKGIHHLFDSAQKEEPKEQPKKFVSNKETKNEA
jgi:hypothetical protein